MFDMTLIMLGAGDSTRFQMPVKKQWLRVGDDPLWLFATKNLSSFYTFKEIIVVSKECDYMQRFAPEYKFVLGGQTRQESLKNALRHVKTEFVLVSDIARPCVTKDMLTKIIESSNLADCVVPVLNVVDTAYYDNESIQREKIKLIQTPQLSRASILLKALNTDKVYTDDSSAIKSNGGSVWQILGDERARKITTKDDLFKLELDSPSKDYFVGNGFDVHELCEGYELWLCGEKIEYELGLKGHSDADVATHALIDAMLGASSLGDIGELFPDSNEIYKGISSMKLLKEVYTKIQSVGFELVNADVTILAEKPKISKFKRKMEFNLSNVLGIKPNKINVKATTTEKLGFIGRGEGIACMSSVSLKYYDWTKK
ncbi:bifunctional 2-C-methyl-D-erythritol 4-phosphate cytidylyltransferase / 2-C-methyl-D-erythritol 2,4-cyclodiphosphate synthase protein [Campylobacter pinnipediorum subsp. caledonicus]|uniref:Bifunctional enzyme IspD/IspF n=1 Tax=Campylobacter pinnipediorum subsp. caledonicus TaxID=1874362 RepID=A0A1S6U7R8_9BACT|nr:bifunctional 2-C-methyl-D-erythritol 4-phosphate cytidylyltransferase/2-C-methyl-D-erythritol 2,4-cyclodiphosphate synthase [Campylobacter pinnipediorum]AQW86178.1 bifunctional 2-C-methyl-D-erythritol 4-phosphate cytidylyltransferase / 2-C-methyl-D-erythritol 2,4-cyclodiphosphate synthase protein [Campylobacter pinnipediorum subsp. caledonicus]AQW87786.1 bifunctional 2-C-methyl-D-erythritol 4-phosphate cytidylyltransferase / 2-C-methyl-D-erythritol 2,4-cyclodiphosphate synthase protein [Campyl